MPILRGKSVGTGMPWFVRGMKKTAMDNCRYLRNEESSLTTSCCVNNNNGDSK